MSIADVVTFGPGGAKPGGYQSRFLLPHGICKVDNSRAGTSGRGRGGHGFVEMVVEVQIKCAARGTTCL